ncbi:MAG: hypothetical protein MJE68_23845 [Proteobacteria bacterium]|nr:hypothetical protein [Pseudomonadota bacterium]
MPAEPSTSSQEPPTKLRRSSRVAAAEAREKMTLVEEVSSKIKEMLIVNPY